jgi:Tfp pilus assembly protein FimV
MAVFYFCVVAFLVFVVYVFVFVRKNSKHADPIAEAEVYMMYGRKAQAIEILEQALVKEPGNFVIENKLKELKIVN